eukprot:8625991-Pyramimonas_sp.AAC.1
MPSLLFPPRSSCVPPFDARADGSPEARVTQPIVRPDLFDAWAQQFPRGRSRQLPLLVLSLFSTVLEPAEGS